MKSFDEHTGAAPVFIISNFRSGSTLLRYLLDSHPLLCSPSEVVLASVGLTLLRVMELTAADDIGTGSERALTGRLLEARRVLDEIMNAYCVRKGKKRWCEKSPANIENLAALFHLFPDAYYVCLHRNAFDQVHSMLDVEGTAHLQNYLGRNGGDELAAAVDRWCTNAEALLAFEHRYRNRATRILYEKIVANPEHELGRLLPRLDLPAVPELSTSAFQQTHDRGPADVKIVSTKRVEQDRVGSGRSLDLKRVPTDLLNRTMKLHQVLGYPTEAC